MLALCYVMFWFLRRSYGGLSDDAHLYAFQALARLRPELGSADLFLKYGSQDNYTLFTPLYAWLISHLDLAHAEAMLTVLFHAWSATATWFIARRFVDAQWCWLVVGVVLVVPGYYGSAGVFEYSENFLTARLPAEALGLTAIALLLFSHPSLALMATAGSLLMHPIMGAPVFAVVALFLLPVRGRYVVVTFAALLTAIAIAVATLNPISSISIMDQQWLEIVRNRSPYLFMENWKGPDWDWALLSIVTLVFCGNVTCQNAWKQVCALSACIGVAGLLATAFVSYVAPLTIVVQVQPWRWMWLATYLAVLGLPLSARYCWKSDQTTKNAWLVLCVAWLLPLAWASPPFIATPLALIAIGSVSLKSAVTERYQRHFAWFARAVLVAGCTAVAASSVPLLQLEFTTNKEPILMERVRDLFGLTLPALVAVFIAWMLTISSRRLLPMIGIALSLTFFTYAQGSKIYAGWTQSKYLTAYESFAPWRSAVDHRRSIWWPYDPIATWLLIESPSYLSVSQTAGLVFSRETALEAARRAASLKPQNGHPHFGIGKSNRSVTRPLTVSTLKAICIDPELGYVVTDQELPVRHLNAPPGPWAKFKLYFCDRTREIGSP